MSKTTLEIGFVTDEVSRDIREAFMLCHQWGVRHFELREGAGARTPYLSEWEIAMIEAQIREGAEITALSPGIFKQPVEDELTIRDDLDRKLEDTIELAQRFDCGTVIIFGFEKMRDDADSRLAVLKTFERAAERAARAEVVLAIENEPAFWVDRPEASMQLLGEIDHPSLALNWDPANLHWGGMTPTAEHIETIAARLHNLHVKDFTPDDPDVPWRPIGEGTTPWGTLLPAVMTAVRESETGLDHITIETHCEPLKENSEASLQAVRNLLDQAVGEIEQS